jgi:hypothetical protein
MIAVDKPKRTRLRREDDDRPIVSQVVVAVVLQGRTACAKSRAVMTVVKESSTINKLDLELPGRQVILFLSFFCCCLTAHSSAPSHAKMWWSHQQNDLRERSSARRA